MRATLIMKVKSVMAGEYTAPPAQGPMISEICGITPDDVTLRYTHVDIHTHVRQSVLIAACEAWPTWKISA